MKLILTENQFNQIVSESYNKKEGNIKDIIKRLHKLPSEYKEFAINHIKTYSKAKNGIVTGLQIPREFQIKLNNENLPNGFDVGVDANGYFIHTHRARSKSYESLVKIIKKDINFIDSTG